MTNKAKRIGILTGGGDCPGLNAVIRATTKALILEHNAQVFGFEDGFQGLIEHRFRELHYDDVSGILQLGGTILGTSNKADPFENPVLENGHLVKKDVSDDVIKFLQDLNIDALVCIGGDGTMTIANELAQKGVQIIGVPKTIDNDLYGTDITFGYDSALSVAAEALDRIHTTAQSHHRVMLVEIMGRTAGWLTLGAGLASGADIILIPEIDYDLDVICNKVIERSKKGRRFSIIAVAEGAKPKGGKQVINRIVKDSPEQIRLGGISIQLGHQIEDETGLETRSTVLGHIQRGGSPTPFDRILATRYGVAAARLVVDGNMNRMVALRGNDIVSVSLAEIGGRTRRVSRNDSLLKTAVAVGTNMGVNGRVADNG